MLLLWADQPARAQELRRFEFAEAHMGMRFKLTFYAADRELAHSAAKAAFARIAELDQVMSDYKPDSELNGFIDGAPHAEPKPLSADLFGVLERSQRLAADSGGAFDVTAAPVIRLWRRARRQKELPDPARLAEAQAAVGYRRLELDPVKKTGRLTKPGMRLDLGGIGAGVAVDAALAVLREHGISRAMVDASGDIGVGDPPPGARGWRIGLGPFDRQEGPPVRFVELANAALTTSGDLWQFLEIDGRRYSHIIDPRTGQPLTDRSTVTVIAADCTTADSVAKVVSVLGPGAGLEFIERMPGAAALFARIGDRGLEVFESTRFPPAAN
ncbi:MAG: FAD:protein FMN transferase [Pirellulales bacterium]